MEFISLILEKGLFRKLLVPIMCYFNSESYLNAQICRKTVTFADLVTHHKSQVTQSVAVLFQSVG